MAGSSVTVASGFSRSSCRRASEGYSGRDNVRDTALATSAQAISVSTRAWPSTISMTMMNEVSGACVTAARKPAMPSAISVGASGKCMIWAMSLPSAAPIDSEGAKMPAGTPDQVVIQVAMNLNST